jgi:hypothetical protein
MQNNIPTVYVSEIYCCIVKSTNISTTLQFCTKNIKKIKNIVLRSVLVITEYFMLIVCLENIGEGLLHACISSY